MNSTSPIDWSYTARNGEGLHAHLLGTVDFRSAVELQTQIATQIAARCDRRGVVLLCEHPPTISLGRAGSRQQLNGEQSEFHQNQIELHWLNRGGGAWIHAPGQLSMYLSLPLDRLRLAGTLVVRQIAGAISAVAQELRVPTETVGPVATCSGTKDERRSLAVGVKGRAGQFGFIGLDGTSEVSQFGGIVNVSVDRQLLRLVDWQTETGRASTLAAHCQRPVSIGTVRESLVRNLARELGFENYTLSTGHPALIRTYRKQHVAIQATPGSPSRGY